MFYKKQRERNLDREEKKKRKIDLSNQNVEVGAGKKIERSSKRYHAIKGGSSENTYLEIVLNKLSRNMIFNLTRATLQLRSSLLGSLFKKNVQGSF